MKIIIFINLLLFSISALSLEFYRCIDGNGDTHLTNLPKASLDKNCKPKNDQYAFLLNQDYQNLSNEFKKYEPLIAEDDDNEFTIGDTTLKMPGMHIFDSEKAYEELQETTSKRNDPVSKFIRGRTEALESIKSLENKRKPDIPSPEEL